MHATQIKHKELVEVLVVVLRGFAPRIIWKVVMDGILRGGHEHSAPARKIVRKSGGSTQYTDLRTTSAGRLREQLRLLSR